MERRNVSQITKRPAAEVVVDCETVRALIRTQHPDLSELPLEKVAAGWDNFIFRLGATMAVRLPRRLAWESALQASPAELATWIHGDLHPQNALVKDSELSGVIDWAAIAAGDSATD